MQVYRLRRRFGVSECRACRVLKQHRSTHRYVPKSRDDEERLVQDMTERARQYGCYGYRRIAATVRCRMAVERQAGRTSVAS